VPSEALEVRGEVGKVNLDPGPVGSAGADEQPPEALLVGEYVLDC